MFEDGQNIQRQDIESASRPLFGHHRVHSQSRRQTEERPFCSAVAIDGCSRDCRLFAVEASVQRQASLQQPISFQRQSEGHCQASSRTVVHPSLAKPRTGGSENAAVGSHRGRGRGLVSSEEAGQRHAGLGLSSAWQRRGGGCGKES
jgi:hypothetical protein